MKMVTKIALEEFCHKFMHTLPKEYLFILGLSRTSSRFRDMTFVILHKPLHNHDKKIHNRTMTPEMFAWMQASRLIGFLLGVGSFTSEENNVKNKIKKNYLSSNPVCPLPKALKEEVVC